MSDRDRLFYDPTLVVTEKLPEHQDHIGGYQHLIASVIIQALHDARNGDKSATKWLNGKGPRPNGPDWCSWIGFDYKHIQSELREMRLRRRRAKL